jgi:hypothetical protein
MSLKRLGFVFFGYFVWWFATWINGDPFSQELAMLCGLVVSWVNDGEDK